MTFKNATPEEAGGLANLSGKFALVTGATSGIGEGVALALAFAGAYVVATGRDEKRGAETVRQIVAGKGKGHFDKLDVTVEDDWKRVVGDIQKRFGRLDILINNAGRGVRGPIETIPMEGHLFEINLNVEAAFVGMHYAWPIMKKNGGGVIMNMNSTAGQHGGNGSICYGGSKGAQLGLTKSAAAAGLKDGIRVISIHPGTTWSPGMQALVEQSEEEFFSKDRNRGIPVGIPARAADVAVPIVFLCSDAARHITGIEFNIDGGQSAR